MNEVFDKYATYYNKIYHKKPYKKEAEFVYKWSNKPPLIIDLGCGTGRHHKYWKSATIGIDKSYEMIKQAKSSPSNIYYIDNIENLYSEFRGFMCYTALFNVVGYCSLQKIISNLEQPRGGVFIFDCWDMNKFAKESFQHKIKKFSWGKVEVIPLWDDIDCILKITVSPKKNEPFTEHHECIPYYQSTIEEICRKYGYEGERKDTKTWTTWYKLTKQ